MARYILFKHDVSTQRGGAELIHATSDSIDALLAIETDQLSDVMEIYDTLTRTITHRADLHGGWEVCGQRVETVRAL